MRFTLAIAALLSVTSAVKLMKGGKGKKEEGPDWAEVFDHVDANKDGKVTKQEAHDAVVAYAKEKGFELPEG